MEDATVVDRKAILHEIKAVQLLRRPVPSATIKATSRICARQRKQKKPETESTQRGKGNARRPKANGKQRVHNLEDVVDEYAFSVSDSYVLGLECGAVQLSVGGTIMNEVLIDSGASCNVVDKETWEDLKGRVISARQKKEHTMFTHTAPLNRLVHWENSSHL